MPPELPDCEPPGCDALGEERPPDELGLGMEGDGSEELEPERPPPEGEGILGDGELRPPEPPELPDEPEDPLEEGGDDEGEGIDVD
jgi:hypothetical protein